MAQMGNPAYPGLALYLEIGLLLVAIGIIAVLYFLVRRIIETFFVAKGKALGSFLLRLNLPVILILIAFLFRLKALRETLHLSQKFNLFLDAAFVFFIVFFLIRLIDASVQGWYLGRRLSFPLPRVLHGLILIVVYLAILFAILKNIMGVNITPFLTTSAILTAILGLSFQGVLSNILSGMSLHLTKSFNSGDWIKVGDYEGIVIDTNWRETRIFDRFSNIIVIPNNTVASEIVTNFSLPDKKTAITIPVKVSYSAPPLLVIEALKEAARDVPEVLDSPAPHAVILSYDDLGISYMLKFWITDFNRKNIISGEVARLIWYKFKRRKIEIPVAVGNQVAGILKSVQEKKRILTEEEEKESAFRTLFNSNFLRYQEGEKAGHLLVPEDEIRDFATLVCKERYTPGEILFKQGEKGESCYIVAKGTIRGEIVYEEGGKKYMSEFRVGPGGIFGEMSLFTGMPRTATGIIEAESELLEIHVDAFAQLLARDPKLADVMAEIVSERNLKNQGFLQKIKELSEKDVRNSTNKKSILERLKSFVLRLKK
jgi:small-conductance mechanosensitive channel/CRP-like cAMP-binding protein